MHHAVVLKGRCTLEALLANGALMRSLVRVLLVPPFVEQPLEAVIKPLATVLALIGQLTAMLDPHVQVEQVLGKLPAVAFAALELLGALVSREVDIEVALFTKGFATLVAEVEFLILGLSSSFRSQLSSPVIFFLFAPAVFWPSSSFSYNRCHFF